MRHGTEQAAGRKVGSEAGSSQRAAAGGLGTASGRLVWFSGQ